MEQHSFIILLILLATMDIVYTFWNVKILRAHKKNWHQTEYNPIVRSSWKNLGLYRGTLIAGIFTLTSLVILGLMIGNNEFFQGMMVGFYIMIHHVHYVNYAHISKKYLKKEMSLIGRILTEW